VGSSPTTGTTVRWKILHPQGRTIDFRERKSQRMILTVRQRCWAISPEKKAPTLGTLGLAYVQNLKTKPFGSYFLDKADFMPLSLPGTGVLPSGGTTAPATAQKSGL
jgi:hypothetical protein